MSCAISLSRYRGVRALLNSWMARSKFGSGWSPTSSALHRLSTPHHPPCTMQMEQPTLPCPKLTSQPRLTMQVVNRCPSGTTLRPRGPILPVRVLVNHPRQLPLGASWHHDRASSQNHHHALPGLALLLPEALERDQQQAGHCLAYPPSSVLPVCSRAAIVTYDGRNSFRCSAANVYMFMLPFSCFPPIPPSWVTQGLSSCSLQSPSQVLGGQIMCLPPLSVVHTLNTVLY